MAWKVGDLLILKNSNPINANSRIEAVVLSKEEERFRGDKGWLYDIKAFNWGLFTFFEWKVPALGRDSTAMMDVSWKVEMEHSDGKHRCCNLCCDLLIDANHKHKPSGNRLWKCKNPNCTVGVWQQADGHFNSLPADVPTRTARSALFQWFEECKHAPGGMRRAKVLLDRVGAIKIGYLNRRECEEYADALRVVASPQPQQSPLIIQALNVLAGKKPSQQPQAPDYPVMRDGVRKLDLD